MTDLAAMPDGLALRLALVAALLVLALVVNAVLTPGPAENITHSLRDE